MKKILIAIDGSEASLHAARLAMTLGGSPELILVNVVAPAFVPPPEVPFNTGPMLEDSMRLAATLLKDAAARLGLKEHRALVLVGSPAEQLCDLAEQEGADLIVIGSKGRGAVSRMLIGSVTDRTVHISKKPVLVVR